MQPWNVPSAPTVQGHPSTPMPHTYPYASKPANEAISSVVSQPPASEVKASGRKELPEVFFSPYFTSQPSMLCAHLHVFIFCLTVSCG